MDKIISINLAGRILPIEEDAFNSLKSYLDSLRAHFAGEEGADEIMADIEARLAELFNERLSASRATITMADVAAVTATLGTVNDIAGEEATGSQAGAAPGAPGSAGTSSASPKQPLMRDAHDSMLGGVCAGVAAYFRLDPAIVRVLFVIATLGGWGLGVLLYIALWVTLPEGRLEPVEGKRLYRSAEHKTIGGVAAGLGAYFGKDPWIFRLIFLLPVVLGMGSGLINFVLGPLLVFSSIGGTLVVTYIVLWAVVPLARTANQKREMRGEPINLASIRDNVAGAAGEFGQRFSERVRPMVSEGASAIGRFIRLMLISMAIGMALLLFFSLLGLLATDTPTLLNRYIFDRKEQTALFWVSVILLLLVPLVVIVVKLARAGMRRRRPIPALGWASGLLWTAGVVCVVFLAASLTRMVRTRYANEAEFAGMPQPVNGTLLVTAMPSDPTNTSVTVHNEDGLGFHWNVLDEGLAVPSVDIRVVMSRDSLYHLTVRRTARGRNRAEAAAYANAIDFAPQITSDGGIRLAGQIPLRDGQKYRGQDVTATLEVPAGKRFSFSESLLDEADVWLPDVDDMDVEPGETYTMSGNWGRNRTVVEHSTHWKHNHKNYREGDWEDDEEE